MKQIYDHLFKQNLWQQNLIKNLKIFSIKMQPRKLIIVAEKLIGVVKKKNAHGKLAFLDLRPLVVRRGWITNYFLENAGC